MLNHGISTGSLFLIVGMVYERRHTRMISEFGGLSKVMPVFAIFFMIVTLSSIGLPGTNGFVGEFLILLGAFQSNVVYGVLAATGVILGAAYMLWMFQRVMFGKITNPKNEKLKDLSPREITVLVPMVIMIFLMGIYPKLFFSKMDVTVEKFLKDFKGKVEMKADAPSTEDNSRSKEIDREIGRSRDRGETTGLRFNTVSPRNPRPFDLLFIGGFSE